MLAKIIPIYRLNWIRFCRLRLYLILCIRVPIPPLLEKFLLGGAIIFITTAISIGVSIAMTDPPPAIYWFSAAAISATIAVFLWDEIAKLSPGWRASITTVIILVVLSVTWLGDSWVINKQDESAQAYIIEMANESRLFVAMKRTTFPPAVPSHEPTKSKAPALGKSRRQEPATPTPVPRLESPRLGTGPDAYKDISDDQVGQWAIEEADKIEQMAKQHIDAFLSGPQKAIFFKAQVGFFSSDFKACCAQDVKDLRGEILRRLGPPAKDVKEEQALKRVFREMDLPPGVPIPPQFSDVDPFGVKEYAPYLRRLGTKLKQRNVPKLGPLELHFSEARRDPEIPEFPYEIVATIETTRELASGYILVKFNGFHNRALCDLEGSRFISESDEINEIGNDELSTLLAKENQVLLRILKIGKIPFLPSKPMHVTAYAKQTFHVSSVTFFDE
jgi:hypothetical protein